MAHRATGHERTGQKGLFSNQELLQGFPCLQSIPVLVLLMEYYVTDGDDIAFEYELQNTSENKVTWRRYLESWKLHEKEVKSTDHIVWLYERFCKQFPADLDVWEEYIKWAMDSGEFEYHVIADLFERSLNHFNKNCDKIGLMFLNFAIREYDISLIRVALNVCLLNVSRAAHADVWEIVLPFIYEVVIPLTKVEDFEYEDEYEELLEMMYQCLFENASQKEKRPGRDLWSAELLVSYLEVCPKDKLFEVLIYLGMTGAYELICLSFDAFLGSNSEFAPNVHVPYQLHIKYLKALKELRKLDQYKKFSVEVQALFPNQKSSLIIELAKYYINEAKLEEVELLLQSSLEATMTVKDFSLIYDFYVSYEKAYAETILKVLGAAGEELPKEVWETRLVQHMDNLEVLTDQRDLKLNDLKLRQNFHSISTWLERADLVNSEAKKCAVFAQAILKIDPGRVKTPGAFGELWCQYASLYWEGGNYDDAREVWDRSLRVPFSYLKDLEIIWVSWVEHELKLENSGVLRAIHLLETALKIPDSPDLLLDKYKKSKTVPAQSVLFSSLKLWSLLLDLVESLCPVDPEYINKTMQIYEQVIMLKVATPLIFINYAQFLQNFKDKQSSFQVYERAIGIFPPETQFEIWNIYLAEATREDTPLSNEHVRDLFDQALDTLLTKKIDCKAISILYSDFEQSNGLPSRSVDILFRGCKNTDNVDSKMILWRLCLSKAELLLGRSESRKFYEECIQTMPNSKIMKFVIDFARTETNLNEKERAREIFRYGAHLIPPQKNIDLWENWDQFELQNGNKETYKDMLKLKRKLESELSVDTEAESRMDGNIEFVSASNDNATNPEEIELDI